MISVYRLTLTGRTDTVEFAFVVRCNVWRLETALDGGPEAPKSSPSNRENKVLQKPLH